MGSHGWLEAERQSRQPFEIDADLYIDPTKAVVSDDLADSVDYALAIERLARVLEGPPARLLEHLAAAMVAELMTLDGVEAVILTLRKLEPPIERSVGSVGVTLSTFGPGVVPG